MTTPEQPTDTALDELIRNAANDFWTEIQCEIEVHNFPTADRFREVFREAIGKAFAAKDAEIAKLHELLWGARCSYCGEVIGADKKNQDIADEELKRHVKSCTKHPYGEMRAKHDTLLHENGKLQTELADAVKQRDQARSAIKRFGNTDEPSEFDWNVLGHIDELENERDSLRAERDEQERLKVNARKKADRVEVVKDRYREALDGIIVRCKEGDSRSDWIPIIERIATESLHLSADKQQETPDDMVHCPSCRRLKIASDIETCASCEFILCNACWIKNGGCNNSDCSSSAENKENKS